MTGRAIKFTLTIGVGNIFTLWFRFSIYVPFTFANRSEKDPRSRIEAYHEHMFCTLRNTTDAIYHSSRRDISALYRRITVIW